MRTSFAVLAVTAMLILAVNAVVGFYLGGMAADDGRRAEWFARHFIVSIGAMLYTTFVQVLAFTYFIVHARMARDAAESAGLPGDDVAAIVRLRRLSVRWLLCGVLPLLATGVVGTRVSLPTDAGQNVGSTLHMIAALVALGANAIALTMQWNLMERNGQITERIYASLPPA